MARERMIGFIALAGIALVASACNNATSSVPGGGSTSSSSAGATTVQAVSSGDLGSILVDDQGYTVYLFENDTGTTSTCTAGCASTWPALSTDGAPTAGQGVTASLLGTTTRDDGTTQVTYNGHPLYRYSGDSAAGQTNGQKIGDVWYAVTPDGTAAGETDSGGNGGYGGGAGGY